MMATRSSAAEKNVEALVERIHELYSITGAPGYMARFWAPEGVDPALDKLKPAEAKHQVHETTMNGQPAFWNGNTSRDQYQGAVLGYSLAYDALTSIKHRAMIRDDIVALASELMKARKQVPVTVRFKLGGWQNMKLLFDLQHVVMNPSEFQDGGPFIQVGSDEDGSDYEDSSLLGAREFIPNLQTVLGQIPLLGALVPPIPRSGSAVMLANIFRVAIQVTENIPSHSADNAAFKAHYAQHINGWLEVMKQYVYLNAGAKCWASYFGINIVYTPLYNLLRLEPDPTIRATIQQQVLAKIWDLVKDHKNTFFTFITDAVGAQGAVSADRLATAKEQLSQFTPPPKPALATDNTGDPRYPPSSQCDNQSTTALDVADRRMSDFIWQRHPFDLKNLTPQPYRVYPAIDYLMAYWMGRHYGHIDAYANGTCLRFK
jgi:hypothetical protein